MPKNPDLTDATGTESRQLAAFCAALRFEDIPDRVTSRCVDLFVDWLGSALSGKGQRAITAIENFARRMGPSAGQSELLTTGAMTSPLFAAMVNAAASHISEQDDVHNGSVFHPGAVVFPAALGLAQDTGISGREFIAACVAGYEAGIRVGEFLGRSHYTVFHTTGTAGTIAAAVAAGHVLNLDEKAMLNAIGSAGTQAAGLWEFLRDAADSKQLHTAKATSDGLMSACLAADGFTGATRILEGKQGMAAGMSSDADPRKIVDRLGTRWALEETSFKWHSSCRHTHPAADALLTIVEEHDLAPESIERITAHVHQGALDVLGPITDPKTVHQAKFSMPATLGLIATHRRADLAGFDGFHTDTRARRFLDRVAMQFDDEVDAAYPGRWIGKVSVLTAGGKTLLGRVDEPKGDPGNTLSRKEISDKFLRLAAYSGAAEGDNAKAILGRAYAIADANNIGMLCR